MRSMRLVEKVHQEIAKLINEGDLAIDATIGNGHDTLLLAKAGATIIGFDIQDLAIENTRRRLSEAGYLDKSDKISLFKTDHAQMINYIPSNWQGNIRIITFNLGYLPGGDKTIITRPESTLHALESAHTLLAKDGYLSIVLYPDHPGGEDEANAVKTWINSLKQTVKHLRPSLDRGPEWFLIQNK